MHRSIHHCHHCTQYIYSVLIPEVAAAIDAYRPRGIPEEAAVFARTVVAAACPAKPTRAKSLLFAASRAGAFAISVGLECRAEVVCHPSVIERFILSAGKPMSGATRRTLRTNLRYLAARVGPTGGHPGPVSLPRERAKAPYTPAEIATYLGLADAQPTMARRMRSSGLLALGAGAGLDGRRPGTGEGC